MDEDNFTSWLTEAKVFGLIDGQHTKSVEVGEFGYFVTGNATRWSQLCNYFVKWSGARAHCKDWHAWFVFSNDLRHETCLCMHND